LRPFVTGILFGGIIAIATWPIRDWLVRHGLSVGLTATVLLLVALGTVGVPAIILAPGLGERLVDGIQRGRRTRRIAGTAELIAQVPWAKESVARLWSSLAEPVARFKR
jgi:predicted PurR-regulated permease PerM